jgi:uncharacterized RDD family membrane protein YckC
LVITYFVALIVGAVFAGVGAGVGGDSGGWAGIFLGLLVALILVGWYWVYLEGSPGGQTLGKRIAGIRVRAVSGGPAGYGKALGRNAFMLVLFIVLAPAWLLDLLWPIWDSEKQCLHDKIASTVVIRN